MSDPSHGELPQPVTPPQDADALRALLDQARALLGEQANGTAGPRTISQVVALYLEHNARAYAPRALAERQRVLNQFVLAHGNRTVGEAKPADLALWVGKQKRWKSDWTRRMAVQIVQRAFNWAQHLGLIPRNPFAGVTWEEGEPRRAMTDTEFSACLRHTKDASFRQVLLFLWHTGCRPGEMSAIRWCDINFELGLIMLAKHKTKKKTRKPRIIPLTPVVWRLLHWLWRRRTAQRPHAEVLRELTAQGPLSAEDFHRRADEAGVPKHDRYRLAREAGLTSWYTGKPGVPGRWVWGLGRPRYHYVIQRADRPGYYGYVSFGSGKQIMKKLDDDELTAQVKMRDWLAELDTEATAAEQAAAEAAPAEEPAPARNLEPVELEHVFLNTKGNAWTRCSLSIRMQKLRYRAGLPADCHLYGTRHAFGTQAVLNGANLTLVSKAMGHSSTAITERAYVHVDREIAAIRATMEQATQRPNKEKPAGRNGAAAPAGQVPQPPPDQAPAVSQSTPPAPTERSPSGCGA